MLDELLRDYLEQDAWTLPGRVNYETLREFEKHNLCFETIVDTADNLTVTMDFTISSINKFLASDSEATPSSLLIMYEFFKSLQGAYFQLKKSVSRHTGYGERLRHIYLTSLNINRSQSITRITVVISVFLPLSLGAGLLSMQTRLVDLNYLLYDFIGISILLGFFMVLAYLAVTFFIRVSEHLPFADENGIFNGTIDVNTHLAESQLSPERARVVKMKYRIRSFWHNIIKPIAGWTVILYIVATFVVGMVDRVDLGLLLLGYSGAVGLVCLALLFLLGVYLSGNHSLL